MDSREYNTNYVTSLPTLSTSDGKGWETHKNILKPAFSLFQNGDYHDCFRTLTLRGEVGKINLIEGKVWLWAKAATHSTAVHPLQQQQHSQHRDDLTPKPMEM